MRNSTQKTLQNFTANFQLPMCAKTLQSSRNFPIVCAKLIAKTQTKFPVEFPKLCKISHQCAFDCAKTLQNYTQIPNSVCNWVPRKLLRTPCEVFLSSVFSQKKETRTAELWWWGCMWWENCFLQKLFEFVCFQNFKNPLPLLLQN